MAKALDLVRRFDQLGDEEPEPGQRPGESESAELQDSEPGAEPALRIGADDERAAGVVDVESPPAGRQAPAEQQRPAPPAERRPASVVQRDTPAEKQLAPPARERQPAPPAREQRSALAPEQPSAFAEQPDIAIRADDRSAAAETVALYRAALDKVSRAFEAAALQAIAPEHLRAVAAEVEETAERLVEGHLAGQPLLAPVMGPYAADRRDFLFPHSVNVAIMAIAVAEELGFERRELVELATAGLLHDVGSVRFPEGTLQRVDSLDPGQWEEVRQRPVHGARILRALGEGWNGVATIVEQAYERMDGSGYPSGLEGDEIALGSRILGAVDFLETYGHLRPYRDGIPGTATMAVRSLMQTEEQYGQDVLKALVRGIGLFPTGSYVHLSSGEIGHVIEARKANPMRPLVRVIRDAGRGRTSEEVVDLTSAPHIYVTGTLTLEEMQELGLAESAAATDEASSTGKKS